MNKTHPIVFVALFGSALALVATPALARGVGGGMGGGIGAGGFGASGMGSASGHFGGLSSSHISTQGSANTNGPNASDRDMGLDRAQDRMSDEGMKHNKASTSQDTNKGRQP